MKSDSSFLLQSLAKNWIDTGYWSLDTGFKRSQAHSQLKILEWHESIMLPPR